MRRARPNPLLLPEPLLSAYASGIFPMDVDGRIEWFSPDPRAILRLDKFHVSGTLRQTVRQRRFELRFNADFRGVMQGCADRPDGTWISREILVAYTRLHELGFAHSVEAWIGDQLAGGLYGVQLGGAFFGESMFHRVRDASKVALVGLVQHMREAGMSLLDVQFRTPHLDRFGVVEIPREEYLRRLDSAIRMDCRFRPGDTK